MAEGANERALAGRVAKILVEKSRADEAVAILSAWAAQGENDEEGQLLLAEALRIEPGSRLAKMAFERMEGLPGEQAELDQAIRRYSAAQLAAIEKANQKPVFHKAQVGYNNNVKYKGAVYHVQTEDSGLERPHVITHLFADGGRILKSHKRTYESEVKRPDVAAFVKQLMKAQHMEMCVALREGELDEIIAGRAAGGMSVLEKPPALTVRRGAGEAIKSSDAAQRRSSPPAPVSRLRLVTMRSLWGGADVYEPVGDEIVLGTEGDVPLTGETFCAPREAVLRYRGGKLRLIDLDGGNGVFVRIRGPVELVPPDELLVGDQMLRLGRNPEPDDGPGPGPTYFYSSPRWSSSFRLVQIWAGGQPGAVCVARGTTIQIGRAVGDMIFPHDPLVADQHCIVEEQAGAIVLTDLGSRAGTFVRVTGEREVSDGDEFAIGRTRLRVELKD